MRVRPFCALLLMLLILSLYRPAFSFAEESIRISHKARALQPGEVVVIQVESAEPLSKVECVVLGKTFTGFTAESGRLWRALVGIDLDARPAGYTTIVRTTDKSGRARDFEYRLSVRPKAFPTRHLTVDEKFVTPPPEVLDRIAAEAKRVEAIFAAVSDRRYWKGRFIPAVPGPQISSFGKRNVINGKPRSPHAGADFKGETGTPISAPNAGRIVLADDLYFSGNTVIIDHGQGLYSYFAHLSQFEVKAGQIVSKGDLLGQVGATGRVTGPHLHWSMRLVGSRVDPLSLIETLRTLTIDE